MPMTLRFLFDAIHYFMRRFPRWRLLATIQQIRRRGTKASLRQSEWSLPQPQLWFERLLNDRSLDCWWKEDFRVSRATFEYICGLALSWKDNVTGILPCISTMSNLFIPAMTRIKPAKGKPLFLYAYVLMSNGACVKCHGHFVWSFWPSHEYLPWDIYLGKCRSHSLNAVSRGERVIYHGKIPLCT